jgi:hypothetical protein
LKSSETIFPSWLLSVHALLLLLCTLNSTIPEENTPTPQQRSFPTTCVKSIAVDNDDNRDKEASPHLRTSRSLLPALLLLVRLLFTRSTPDIQEKFSKKKNKKKKRRFAKAVLYPLV